MDNKIVLSEPMRSLLSQAGDEAELLNERGEQVGFFLTPALYSRLLCATAKAQVDEKELQEAREEMRSKGGLTTAEILGVLHSLEKKAP